MNSLDPAHINQYISSCYATIHGAWHNGRAGKVFYGFDGTHADLSELTVTWESSWCQCRSSVLGVRAVSMFLALAAEWWTKGCGQQWNRLSCVSVSVQTAKCLKLQVRSGGPGEHYQCNGMLGNPAEGSCFPYFRCWQGEKRGEVFGNTSSDKCGEGSRVQAGEVVSRTSSVSA